MPLVFFYTSWKHQKTSSFFIFSGGKERDERQETGYLLKISVYYCICFSHTGKFSDKSVSTLFSWKFSLSKLLMIFDNLGRLLFHEKYSRAQPTNARILTPSARSTTSAIQPILLMTVKDSVFSTFQISWDIIMKIATKPRVTKNKIHDNYTAQKMKFSITDFFSKCD